MIIIGILAAIAIPVFLAQQRRAQVSTCQSDARNAGAAATSFRAGPGNGGYTGLNLAALEAQGFNPSDNTAGNYPVTVGTATATDATITVGCKGVGSASWNAQTGIVTPPSA